MIEMLILIFPLVLGWFLQQLKALPETTADVLNRFVISVSFPALVLQKAPLIEFNGESWLAILIPWLAVLVSVILVLFLARIFQWQRNITAVLLLMVPLGNTSFLGFPLVQHFYSDEGLAVALVYDQLGSFLALSIYGTLIVSLYSDQQQKVTVWGVIQKIVFFPPFVCLILALLLPELMSSNIIQQLTEPLAATLIPLVLVAVGLQLKFKVRADLIGPLLSGLMLKLLLIPLLFYFSFKGFVDTESLVFKVSIFELSMAPMITAAVLASLAGFSRVLSSALISYGILLAMVTLPLVHHWLS